MLLTLVIVLLLIWAAVVWSLYSNFLVFYENFSETDNYNKAYYASIAALERWELVVKQRDPWYIWSWWWQTSIEWIWRSIGYSSDWLITGFSYLSSGNDKRSEVLRTINSRATRIPSTWNWNVELLLSDWDSNYYNMMDYENAEIFLLYYDTSTQSPYSWWIIEKSRPDSITAKIRIPWLLHDSWWDLNAAKSLISTWATDDAIVDWQIRWKYNNLPFTIYATQNVVNRSVWKEWDTAIRESIINKWSNDSNFFLSFGGKWAPFSIGSNTPHTNIVTIISSAEDQIKSLWNFNKVFKDSNTSDLQLRFSLLNLLQAEHGKIIYPFLEYYVDFWWTTVSDKYYTIDAEWSIWDFQVNTIIQKPTAKESILWNFTAVF